MPPGIYGNSQLPRSSSSISLNESPGEEINYDSDISEDDNAIAEGDDDEYDDEEDGVAEEEEEPDEGFALEVNTLSGNKFSIMIHPSDTVEVLKTRIAFQEGISPADQNLLLEHGKLIDSTGECATIEELNIDRNSKLTLVANMASGVPYKTHNPPGGALLPDNTEEDKDTSFKLAPSLRRSCSNNNNHNPSNCSSNSSSSLRLPKILSLNGCGSTTLYHLDKNSNIVTGGATGNGESQHEQRTNRLDEREWMKSLFNKVAQQEDENGDSSTRLVIDIDSTTSTVAGESPSAVVLPQENNQARISTRYSGTKTTEEDGSLLVVQGDDGVILIIQKNTGQLLDDLGETCMDDGRMARLGRYTKNGAGGESQGDYKRSRFQHGNKVVSDKIRENAVTLEKMRQVRGQIAQQKIGRDRTLEELENDGKKRSMKGVEFPKISEGHDSRSKMIQGGTGRNAVGYRTNGGAGRKSANKTGRSINSSKMCLNRLIAEIYLQSKRKDRQGFQPGQPPYTDQQLVRYVTLKTAILLEEQKRNKTEPCTKCQQHGDWSFSQSRYLIPTVVMNRYKKLGFCRNSRSLDKDVDCEDTSISRRKSMIPVVAPSSTIPALRQAHSKSQVGEKSKAHRTESFIPRLIVVNRATTEVTQENYRRCSGISTTTITDFKGSKEALILDEDFDTLDVDAHETIILSSKNIPTIKPIYKVHPKMSSTAVSMCPQLSPRPGKG